MTFPCLSDRGHAGARCAGGWRIVFTCWVPARGRWASAWTRLDPVLSNLPCLGLTERPCQGETGEEVANIARTLRARSVPVDAGVDTLDIVGTGGDGIGSVNISTGASVIAAAAGARVAKHGSRSVSSLCGSADVLEVRLAAAVPASVLSTVFLALLTTGARQGCMPTQLNPTLRVWFACWSWSILWARRAWKPLQQLWM